MTCQSDNEVKLINKTIVLTPLLLISLLNKTKLSVKSFVLLDFLCNFVVIITKNKS